VCQKYVDQIAGLPAAPTKKLQSSTNKGYDPGDEAATVNTNLYFTMHVPRRNIPDLEGLSLDHPGRRHSFSSTRKRILKSAVFVLGTMYFMVDAVFLTIATPLARWMARQRVFIRLRKWIGSLRPYSSLALFAVPLIVLEPVKPLAAYLMGQIAAGVLARSSVKRQR
jgi:hypothetical protein